MRRGALAALSVFLLAIHTPAALSGRGQDPPLPEYGEVIDVREAQIDALALDTRGDVVAGLGSRDFSVRQNGERVRLVSTLFFDCLEATSIAGEESLRSPRPESRFFAALLLGYSPRAAEAARAIKVWSASLQPWDYLAVAIYAAGFDVQTAAFTRERSASTRALGAWQAVSSRSSTWPGALAVLREIAREYAPIQRRKNLILFVDDLGAAPSRAELASTARALNIAGVATYTVDLSSPTVRPELVQLSDDTSAQHYPSSWGVTLPLADIRRQNRGYYLLSFIPLAGTKPGDQHATVSMRAARYRALGLPRQWPEK